MDKKDLRIVFLGTPDFAVESLRCLVENGYNVVGVVTTPDKPVGRHQNHLLPSPIKVYAQTVGLPILQPEKLKSEEFITQLQHLHADLQIVVAFRMLPEIVWSMPRYGTFNLHASLLPQYRGAAPINWAIINGEKETGLTTFFLSHDIDVGDIIDQVCIPIKKEDTFGDIHDKLMTLGGKLVLKTVDNILNGHITSKPQSEFIHNEQQLKPAPKIFRDTCRIHWDEDSVSIYNFIRGLSPVPTAWTLLQKEDGREECVKIFKAQVSQELCPLSPGSIISDGKHFFNVATKNGQIEILELQIAGKKKMTIEDFMRGFKFSGKEKMV